MRTQTATQRNSTACIRPTPQPKAPWLVKSASALPGFRLSVIFMDGTQGQVDLSVRVHAADGGVFNALADTDEFEKVFVQYGAVTWPCGVDLAPDAMYDSIRQTGFWHLV